jgi:hypothetical protein
MSLPADFTNYTLSYCFICINVSLNKLEIDPRRDKYRDKYRDKLGQFP